ncbi:MAG: response regulator, partial [Burkholderiaceae bacterium]|nr:response regulator [Burkholderiaceae bacterium]
ILLVEDNPMDVDLTKRALRRHRLAAELMIARDGEEAVNMIARWETGEPSPTLILLDLKLPRLSGLEVLERLKAHPSYASIPVVVLTTSRDDGDVKRAYQLGANSYIVKPVDFDRFLEVASQIELYWTVLNEPSPQ